MCLNRDEWEVAVRKPGWSVCVFLGAQTQGCFHKETEQTFLLSVRLPSWLAGNGRDTLAWIDWYNLSFLPESALLLQMFHHKLGGLRDLLVS